MSSRLGLAAVLVCATALVAGCAPQPDPTPTQTAAFASEDEAFAAAEETYRAYVDALNNVDLSDPATFEDVYKWETGDALADEKKSLTQMHADAWVMDGVTKPGRATLVEYSPRSNELITIHVCMDVGDVKVQDADGNSLVSDTRPDVQPLEVALELEAASRTELVISRTAGSDQLCDS